VEYSGEHSPGKSYIVQVGIVACDWNNKQSNTDWQRTQHIDQRNFSDRIVVVSYMYVQNDMV
jgi:hypothetical protein